MEFDHFSFYDVICGILKYWKFALTSEFESVILEGKQQLNQICILYKDITHCSQGNIAFMIMLQFFIKIGLLSKMIPLNSPYSLT